MSPATAMTGSLLGVTARDGGDAGLQPYLLWAATLNVYTVPFVKPPTTRGGTDEKNTTAGFATPATNGVTRYASTTAPFADDGAGHATDAEPSAGMTVTPEGAVGVPTTTATDGADAGLQPYLLWAATLNVYAVPFV